MMLPRSLLPQSPHFNRYPHATYVKHRHHALARGAVTPPGLAYPMHAHRGWKADSSVTVEISPNCPRCGSSNTKFCYYNNYSSSQPRYFCKGCRRYWTKGGSLRNVPVGGGCRKSRRGKCNNNNTLRQANVNAVGHNIDSDMRRASSSVVSVSDAPNIDLAQVYASFLNHKPDQVQTLCCPFSDLNTDFDFGHTAFSQELGLTDFGDDIHMYFCGFNSIQMHTTNTNFELPPLPGEEAQISHADMLWSKSNSHEIIADHALQATKPPLFAPQAYDAEFLMSNCWNHFDLPRDASFFAPS
ncbi:hypothetical protein VNO78_17928 [Psophocarpus tetragonolobus]|uniref:Dof zinc finger protein n=1 Tax=Psophocarpus tetragonolobus TaxID=3891 RepID=A0AAN9SIF0_PSOTE